MSNGKRWRPLAGKPSIGTETLFRPTRPPLLPAELFADLKSMRERGVNDQAQIGLLAKALNGYAIAGFNDALDQTKFVVGKSLDGMKKL